MTDLIDKKYKSVASDLRPLDFARISQYFTLDVLTDIAFNRPLGYLTSDSDPYLYLETLEPSLAFTFTVSFLPLVRDFLDLTWVRRILAPSPDDLTGFGALMGYECSFIRDRLVLSPII